MRIARASFIAVALVTMLMSLAACNSKEPKLRHEPVVVYASAEDEAELPKWFADFSEETDIPVTVSYAEPAVQSRSVIENTGSPPADILLTNNIADVWRAADQGALRPIQAAALEAVPSTLKDPDGFWVALDYRRAVIAVGAKAGLDRPRTYADLAAPAYRGHVCLASSGDSVNRSVIAMLIADIGARPTELIVRGWVKNFALPPFKTQKKLLAALKLGRCDYGIVSSTSVEDDTPTIQPEVTYIDIDGIGIARHARYPESAQRLLEWMLSEKALAEPSDVSRLNIGVAGWGDEDAVMLSERAGYR